MVNLSFCITEDDYEEAHKAIDCPEKAEEKIWILPGRRAWKGSTLVTVIDNRSHEAFTEDFNTLDGALLYALDVHCTTDDQEGWDYLGALLDGLDNDGHVVQETYGYCPKCNELVENDSGCCPKCDHPLKYIRSRGEDMPKHVMEAISEKVVINVDKNKMKEIPLGTTEQRLQKLEAKIEEIYERHGWL